MIPKENGYYWVRTNPANDWIVAERAAGLWYLPGVGRSLTEQMIVGWEILPTPLAPPVVNPGVEPPIDIFDAAPASTSPALDRLLARRAKQP